MNEHQDTDKTNNANVLDWTSTYQVGVVVHDIDRAVAFYEALGIGPFTENGSATAIERHVHGKLSPSTVVQGRVAPMGDLELELLSPVNGPSVQSEWLESRGEGVIHVCARTDDLDAVISEMERRGFPAASAGTFANGERFAYFDTREVGGVFLEFMQPGEG
jgi:4-hydroxyphenylpyruvate dioxygenase-like putative hemolysin